MLDWVFLSMINVRLGVFVNDNVRLGVFAYFLPKWRIGLEHNKKPTFGSKHPNYILYMFISV